MIRCLRADLRRGVGSGLPGLLLAAAIPLAQDALVDPVTIGIALVSFVLLFSTKARHSSGSFQRVRCVPVGGTHWRPKPHTLKVASFKDPRPDCCLETRAREKSTG